MISSLDRARVQPRLRSRGRARGARECVLRGDQDWHEPGFSMAMNSGIEKHVRLTATIPVHIVYFTAWVDDKGGLHFQPDVYGYDK